MSLPPRGLTLRVFAVFCLLTISLIHSGTASHAESKNSTGTLGLMPVAYGASIWEYVLTAILLPSGPQIPADAQNDDTSKPAVLAVATVSYTDMGSITCPAEPVATIGPAVPGLTFSQLSRGSGVTCASNTSGISGFGFNGDLPTNLAASKWYKLSIASDSGTAFTVDALSIVASVSTSTAANRINVQYSIDGGAKTSIGEFTPTGSSATAFPIVPSSIVAVGPGHTLNLFFVPYNPNASGTTIRIQNNTSITVTTSPVEYTLTYDGNGNTGGTAPVDPNNPYNATEWVGVVGPGDLVKTSYTFGGWNTAANGSGIHYDPAQLFEINANTTLYAQWIIAPCFETASGSLDTTFDGDGKVTTAIGLSDSPATAVALQPDGMIVTAGSAFNGSNYDFALARYTPTGSLDTNFDIDGVVITPVQSGNDYALAVAMQPDGKIIAAGYTNNGPSSDFAVVRYNANGTLDPTFDGDGIVTTPVQSLEDIATSVAIQPDGKIVVAGFSQLSGYDFAVVRYNADGSLDLSFDGDGKVTTPVLSLDDKAYSVLIQPDGKIVVIGTAITSGPTNDVAAVRYNSHGTLDNSFGGDGKVTVPVSPSDDQARTGALQPDGKILAAGSYFAGPNGGFSLVRFNSDGTLDTAFDGDGIVTTPVPGSIGIALSMALQPDGRIVTAGNATNGSTYDFTLFRYNGDGSIDTTFDGDGKITTPLGWTSYANSVAIQPDGRIVAAGSGHTGSNNDRAVVRYGGDCPPALSVADVSVNEGDNGTTTFSFTVSLPEPAPAAGVTFDIATADGTAQDDNPATEDNDYVARSLTSQTISAGNTTYTFDVTVNGDTIFEPDETFFVNVTNVAGANIADGQGQGTIQNDDVDGETIAALDGSGNVTVTDVNDASSEVLTLTCSSGVLTVTSNLTIGAGAGFTQSGPSAVTIPIAGITGSLTVDTLGGNDTLNVNLAGCDFIPAGGLFFNGGVAGDDALNIIGGNQGTVTYGYGTTNGDGTVAMSNFGTITYTGLEPITNSGTSSDVIFNLPAVANSATLADIGGGSSRLSGGTFEQTDFVNPTGSVTINRGTAADTLAVGALAANYPSLTIGSSGGEFSTITFNGAVTFGAGKNLSGFATGAINFPNAASDVAATGAGTIGLITATNISMAPGSSLTTADGALTVNANQQSPATTGNFAGIFVNGATLGSTGAGGVTVNGLGGTTGGGNIGVLVQGTSAMITTGGGNVTVQGKAGSAAIANQNLMGVAVTNGGTITAGGAGAVSVTGNGTTNGGVNASHGVWVTGANSIITSGGGAVSVTGTGGTTPGGANFGIAIQAGGKITSGSNGTVTLNGTGGIGGSNNFGVAISDPNSTVTTSGAGDLSITGNGGSGTGPAQRGVVVSAAATVSSTNVGKVTINGTGGNGSTDNYGVDIVDANSLVTTTGTGDLSITGVAGPGTGGNLIGVEIRAASAVSSTGGGKVTVTGTGGSSTTFNAGVIVTNATVSSNAGDISLIGQGGTGSGFAQIGVNIDTGADITATGNAKISINGTSGIGSTDSYGVGFETGNVAGTTVSSVNGDISITGVSTDTTGQRNSGVRFEDSVSATAFVLNITGTGNLNITGTAGNNDPTSAGIQFVDDAQLTLSGTSNSFIADRIAIGASNVGINAGANAVSIRQLTNSRSINLGGADSATELGLTDAELDRITAGTINIGNSNSGAISVTGVISPANYKTLSVQNSVAFTSTGGFDSDVTSLTVFEKMLAAGAVSVDPAATLAATAIGGFVPAHGNSFTMIENTTGAATTGTFAGKPEGGSLTLGGVNAFITYAGGTGANDVVINVDNLAPKVTSTTPAQGAAGVATNSNITLNFSEAVNIAAGGITVDCGGVQAFAPTLPQNGVTSIVIDPTNLLPAGVVCTVTAVSANINDLAGNVFDGDGNGTGGDNFVLTFTTACTNSIVVATNADSGPGSLRQAVIDACPGSTITFDINTVVSPLSLSTGQIMLTKDVNIQGPGANVLTVQNTQSPSTTSRVFELSSGVTANISGLTISGGNVTGASGGGILSNGSLTLTAVAIDGNSSGNGAGGGVAATGTLNVIDSTISNNDAVLSGAIYPFGVAILNIKNSTLSGNSTINVGGAITESGTSLGSLTTIENSTITNNSTTAANGGGIFVVRTPVIRSTIIAGNTATNSPDVFGGVASQGYNLVGIGNGSSGFVATGDQVGNIGSPLNPQLLALASNGGPTKTHALCAAAGFPIGCAGESPALAKGKNALTPLTTDQRGTGFPRTVINPFITPAPGGDHTDIGAFEVQALPVDLTYDGNGNTGGAAPIDANSPYYSGSWVGVLGQGTLVNTGFGFGGWNTAADGSGTHYNPAHLFAITADTTLYAEWIIAPCFYSATGSLDPTFDTDGKVRTPVGTGAEAHSVAIQQDGKIVAAGYGHNGSNWDFALVRYNPDGSLDNSFGTGGKVLTPVGNSDDYAYSVAIQSDGKIVAAGKSISTSNEDFAVVRYNADGSLDTTFGTGGKVTTNIMFNDSASAVVIQPDGKIVAAGSSTDTVSYDFALVRYNANGSLDNSFGTGGKVQTDVAGIDLLSSVALLPDGRIVAAGASRGATDYDFALVRYNADGSLDTSFDTDGKVTTPILSADDHAQAVALQPDGHIVAAGYSYNGSDEDFAVVRYNVDGSLDTTFGTGGKVTTAVLSSHDRANSVAIQPDGRIVAAGYSVFATFPDFALVRYNPDGSLDNTFDGDGKLTTPEFGSDEFIFSIAIQPNGRVVAAGGSVTVPTGNFALARYGGDCDTTPPDTTITGNPTNPTNSTSAAFTFTSNETPVTFECSLDGSAFAVCTSPQSYAGLALGSHTFQVRATDAAGNTDPTPASYTWVINSPPTISAAGGVTRVQAAGPSVSQIATVGDPDQTANTLAVTVNGGPSATVNGVTVSSITIAPSGAVSASVAAACGATNASFTLRVTDSSGLFAQAALAVTVINETVPPVINPIANVVATLPSNSPATSMAVNFPLPTATDNCSAVVVTTNPVSGSVFPLGPTVVNVTATDANGNVSTATFTVTVQYAFLGFTGRVYNPPTINYATAGNTLPMSFSLGGNKGLNIFAAGSPSSQQVSCSTGAPVGQFIPAIGNLMYFGQYSYYWTTDPAWGGTCRTFSMTLNDGSNRTLKFWFYNTPGVPPVFIKPGRTRLDLMMPVD